MRDWTEKEELLSVFSVRENLDQSNKTRGTRQLEKNCHFFKKEPKKLPSQKKAKISTTKLNLKTQNIYNKAQFENPKHLHQTTFKP